MRVGRCHLALLIACSLVMAGASDADDSDEDASSLADSVLSLDPEPLMVSFSSLLHTKHGGDVSKLFSAYNRFHDASKVDGEQALGNQEVRALLKDVGLGNLAVRGELASLAIRIADSSGDGRVSEAELRATVDVAGCWLGKGDSDAVLEPSRRLSTRLGAAISAESLDSVFDIVQQEVHTCSAPIGAWWASGWLSRLQREERASPIVSADLSLPHEAKCVDALLGRALAHGKKSDGDGAKGTLASRGQLRKSLKQAGVDSLLARHLLASALLDALDDDRDKRLGAHELRDGLTLACRAYASVTERSTTLATAVRALSLPTAAGGFSPVDFRDALNSNEKAAVARIPAEQLAIARAAIAHAATKLSPEVSTALAASYVRLLPAAALKVGGERAKDEL
jgi:hypothetical protein